MDFRPLVRAEACWRTWDRAGLQRVVLWAGENEIVAEGAVVVPGEDGFAAAFRIACDAGWRVREAEVRVAGGPALVLASDGEGRWTGPGGERLGTLDGCIDVDLQASPLTNVLPIRRTKFRRGDIRTFQMVYIPFPSLKPFVDEQRYTCLEPCGLYRYEAADGSFAAELPVDEDGLVLDYPSLFRRVRRD